MIIPDPNCCATSVAVVVAGDFVVVGAVVALWCYLFQHYVRHCHSDQ